MVVQVHDWLNENQFDWQDNLNYAHIVGSTVTHLNSECDEGVFYYIWLNAYLREVTYFGWREIDHKLKNNGVTSEKIRVKEADAKVSEFEKFCKHTFQ
jgi:hypothetical protein